MSAAFEAAKAYGVTVDQVLAARETAMAMKRDIRDAARRAADDLAFDLYSNSLDRLSKSDTKPDFLARVDHRTMVLVRRRYTDSGAHSPDLLADRVRAYAAGSGWTDSRALEHLLELWLIEDGLRSLANGRHPQYVNPDNLFHSGYELEGFALSELFGKSPAEAAAYVASVLAERERASTPAPAALQPLPHF